MMGVGMKFTDNSKKITAQVDEANNMALAHMAIDIEIFAKTHVPVSNTKASGNRRGGGGHLQSSITHRKLKSLHYEVTANKEYAEYQERGMRRDGTHRVKKYSTAGTGKGYFKRGIEMVKGRSVNYFKEAKQAVGL